MADRAGEIIAKLRERGVSDDLLNDVHVALESKQPAEEENVIDALDQPGFSRRLMEISVKVDELQKAVADLTAKVDALGGA